VRNDRRPPSLNDLGARLDEARSAQDRRRGKGSRDQAARGFGAGLQIAVEVVAAVAVGVAIGWALDEWFGTRPWFLVVFFVLGVAAAGMNVYRRAARIVGLSDKRHDAGHGAGQDAGQGGRRD